MDFIWYIKWERASPPFSRRYVQGGLFSIDKSQLVKLLGRAKDRKQKVRFHYLEYGADKKLHRRRRDNETIRICKATPYQMVAQGERLYLIYDNDNYDELASYRPTSVIVCSAKRSSVG